MGLVIQLPIAIPEIEISFNPVIKPSQLLKVKSSKDVYDAFIATWDESKLYLVEHFKIMLLNQASRVLGICLISTGTMAQSLCDPKIIFITALKARATAIILCHNHPSGSIKPSQCDMLITERMKEAGKLLDLKVIDHIIIGDEGYYSFADEGIL